jgi:transcriptional regulator GlxA family with amidase domain
MRQKMTQIVFLFYEGMTALDAIGPHEILSRIPGASVKRVSVSPGEIHTSSELILKTEYGLSEVSHADVLVVPGGGKATALREYPAILEWIRQIHSTTEWTTSVCTGSLILGAAGILSAVRATTHWAVMDRLKTWDAIPTESRVVEDGKIITAAGVSAGLDMALVLTAKLAGQALAETLQLGIEYDPAPPFNAGNPKKANPVLAKKLKAKLLERFESA